MPASDSDEVVRRRILLHCTGETVPASDSDEDVRVDVALDGPMREREEYVLKAIAQRHGITRQVDTVL